MISIVICALAPSLPYFANKRFTESTNRKVNADNERRVTQNGANMEWQKRKMELAYLKLLVLTITFGSSFTVMGYEDHASTKDWPVVAWLSGYGQWVRILSLVGLVGSGVIAFLIAQWWIAAMVLLAGFLLSVSGISLLKWRVQIIAVIGIIAGSLLSVTYVL